MKRLLVPALCVALAMPAISAADYLDRSGWTWSTSSDCEAEGDISGLAGIHDGNTYTCWHSNYHAASGTPERSNPHWIMIDRGSDSSLAYGLAYVPRQATGDNPGTACTEYAIYFADRTFAGTTAASYEEIVQALGNPDVSGSWAGDSSEKFVTFGKPVSARYILFVNVKSNGSNSAACSEMNLLGKGGSGIIDPSNPGYNAIRIVTPEGAEHRIAIDGEQLAFSIADGNIRMGNSAITVEYSMDEVRYFQPEKYAFDEEEFYNGPKTDIYYKPVEVSLDLESLTLEEGTSATLTATVENAPEGAETVWTSSDETVVTVSADGQVSAVAPGEATVTVTCADASASCRVTVTAKPAVPVEISLTPSTLSLEVGKTYQLQATVSNAEDSDRILWSSSDETVATVSAEGLVTAIAAGNATVTATCGDASALCQVTVVDGEQSAIGAVATPAALTLRREGDCLLVGGVTPGSEVGLISLAGVKLCSSVAGEGSVASLAVGSLQRGAYLLSASGLTLKITL